MKVRSHSSATFVMLVFHKRATWIPTWLLFMKEESLLSVELVMLVLHEKGQWIDTLHQFMYLGKKPFQCDICDYSCSQKRDLNKHVASVHEEKKGFQVHLTFNKTVDNFLKLLFLHHHR